VSSILFMSTSVDGFVAGPNDGPGNGLGDGGDVLHDWLSDGRGGIGPSGVNGELFAELLTTGAVVVGRRTFEMADEWNGDHHDGVPIFVLTRRAGDTPRWPLVTYVDDIADGMRRAKEAAGERDVLVHGSTLARLALDAGVLDELLISQVPVLLGGGRPLFDGTGPGALELVRVVEAPGVTHLRYRVARASR
jgi:dihydrofolate reductase